jgi:hypothetical protein
MGIGMSDPMFPLPVPLATAIRLGCHRRPYISASAVIQLGCKCFLFTYNRVRFRILRLRVYLPTDDFAVETPYLDEIVRWCDVKRGSDAILTER